MCFLYFNAALHGHAGDSVNVVGFGGADGTAGDLPLLLAYFFSFTTLWKKIISGKSPYFLSPFRRALAPIGALTGAILSASGVGR